MPIKCFEFKMLYSSWMASGTWSAFLVLPWSSPKRLSTYLSSSVDNLCSVVLSLKPDHFTKGVLDGRVVAFDKVAIDELDREGGFAYCCQGLTGQQWAWSNLRFMDWRSSSVCTLEAWSQKNKTSSRCWIKRVSLFSFLLVHFRCVCFFFFFFFH